MICPSCAEDNRPGAKFCGNCGQPLKRRCAACGSELAAGARFCDECGAPTSGAPAPARPSGPSGARKIVTILFADLVGSTGLHERLDPESARRFMESYYAAARGAVEGHGGTVTQFLGDGVKAVFGVPRVAEDDALRAVRAGVAMQEAFRALAREQRGAVGETGLRVAVNTGEVVAKGETEIIGDPVNVAARLQERGRDGDVVIGESTRRLVAAQVSLEPLGSFDLKGRAEAVRAYRVVSLDPPGGAAATAFVGREQELARIGAVYERAVATPATHLAVLLGSPGLGKSRLIGEFALRSGESATVVAARCDAAGGATFAPLAAALRELLEIEAGASVGSTRAAVEAAMPGDSGERERVAAGVTAILTGSPGAPEETFFVVRRFLAAQAAVRPVVLVIDDLQWAEPLLLDLVEHLVQWGRELPLFVLIGARPELREVRSSFAVPGGLVADVVTLDGLDAGAAMRLAAGVIGAADLPAAVAARVLASSEGNPLFIGELVRMLVDEGALVRDGDRWRAGETLATVEMPPTIHALLAARIERLAPEQCVILERAAVVGRHFSRSAVASLLPGDGTGVEAQLESLQRAQLVERDTGWLLGEPVLRFHHVLIRDAAYRRLLKGTRAELHQRLADWMEGRAAGAPEHDETIGRHLEEAHRLLGELGPLDAAGQRLGERAAARLAAAGRRALEADDVALAGSLLGRALDRLAADDPTRAELALDWCEALLAAGDVARASVAIGELGRLVELSSAGPPRRAEGNAGDRLRAWHTCFVGQHTVLTAPEGLSATVEVVAAAAKSLASLDDAAGEAKGHFVHALALVRLGRVGACEAALDLALAAARRADDRRRANTVLALAPLAALWGPSPVTRASGRCLDVVRVLRITQGAPAVEAVALSCQGVLEALRGRVDAARRMIASGRKLVEELGIAQRLFETDVFAGLVALLEGDAAAAERTLRGAYDGLRELGLGIDAARAAALLARALLAQDRSDEAEALSHESEALAGDDLKAAIAWRGVRAEALARRGEHGAAIDLAQTAVGIAATTDALLDHADARLALAAALRAAGHRNEADAEERQAIALWEAKGATLLADRAQGRAAEGQAAGRIVSGIEAGSEGSAVRSSAEAAPAAAAHAGARRRVRPTAARRSMLAFAAAIAARDRAAIEALLGDPVDVVEHPTWATYGREALLESIEHTLRHPDLEFGLEVLATLGDALCLGRRRIAASATTGGLFDIAAYEMDHILLQEVDGDGRSRRFELFAPDRLGDGIHRLYERYAELLPEGPARERAATAARAVRMSLMSFDLAPGEPLIDPDIELADHRRLGSWNATGAPAMVRHADALHDVAREAVMLEEDILTLEASGFLFRRLHSGTERVGGGIHERQFYLLGVLASDGRLRRVEFFDLGDEAQAFARFDELIADSRDSPPASSPARRAVRPNAATRLIDGFVAAIGARDAVALEGLLAEDLRFEHRPTGSSYGAREFMTTWRGAFAADRLDFELEVIASLGESLALHRHRVSVGGLRDAGMADFGAVLFDELVVAEADPAGLCRRIDLYAPDKLRDAVVRLYQSYAESLAEGASRARAAQVARSVAVWTGASTDPELYTTAIAPAAALVDHRVLATWSSGDAAELLQHFRLQRELAPDFACRLEEVLAVEPGAFLVRNAYFGTDRASGGSFENRVCVLFVGGADGRVAHFEAFEPEDGAAALARFDELTGHAAPALAVFENAASLVARELARCFHARDWARIEALAAPEVVYDERRRLLHNRCGREVWLEQLRVMFDVPASRFAAELRATRGERLSLTRIRFTGEVQGGGSRLEMDDHLALHEVDRDGRIVAIVLFDLEAEEAAYAELDRRYEAGEAAVPSRSWVSISAFVDAIGRRDWAAVRACCSEHFLEHDHRGLAVLGRTEGRDAWAANFRALVELAPDTVYRAHHVLAAQRGYFVHGSWYGTREGGPYELQVNAVIELDDAGRIRRADIYDDTVMAAALARLAELGPRSDGAGRRGDRAIDASGRSDRDAAEPSIARDSAERDAPDPNLARPSAVMRAMSAWFDGYERALATGRWNDLVRGCRPDFVFDDRRRLALLRGGLELLIASARERGATGARPEWRPVRYFGDRVVLQNVLWGGGPSDGRFEIEYLSVIECDEQGLLTAFVLFDLDDVRAAQSEAWARWAAINPTAAAAPEEPRPGPLRIPHNQATRLSQRVHDIRTSGTVDDLRSLVAEGFRFEDRKRRALVSGGVDEWMRALDFLWNEVGARVARTELVATAGDRLALDRVWWREARGGGAFEIESYRLVEVDATGKLCAMVIFDGDDRAGASAELLERYLAIGAHGMPRGGVEFLRGVNAHDSARLRGGLSEDFVMEDRRRTGMGHLEGADRYVESAVALWELIPDARIEVLYVAAMARHGRVSVNRIAGHDREGGEVESLIVALMHHPGEKLSRLELFEVEHLDAALARLAELGGGRPTGAVGSG